MIRRDFKFFNRLDALIIKVESNNETLKMKSLLK
jgi:hypothetical protein